MDSGQKLVLSSLRDGFKAESEYLNSTPHSFDENAPEKLDSNIRPENVGKIYDILEKAQEETPKFLSGILLSYDDAWIIRDLLKDVGYDLSMGAKHEHNVNRSFAASNKMVGGFLTSLLGNALKTKDGK